MGGSLLDRRGRRRGRDGQELWPARYGGHKGNDNNGEGSRGLAKGRDPKRHGISGGIQDSNSAPNEAGPLLSEGAGTSRQRREVSSVCAKRRYCGGKPRAHPTGQSTSRMGRGGGGR